jgi:hypothetical protein
MHGLRALMVGVAMVLIGGAASVAQTLEPIVFSTSVPAEDIVAVTAPAAPANLQAQAVQTTEVVLLWQDKSNNEAQFDVEARPASDPNFTPVGSVSANVIAVFVSNLAPATSYFFRVRATNAAGSSGYSNVASATTLTSDSPCTPTADSICLNASRFRVKASFLTPQGDSGDAQAVKLTDDSGYLWFFASTNIEAVVKVLNACTGFNRYWFFAGGLTNVRVLLTVTDTMHSATKAYINPQGIAFQPIQDTGAFATCP